LGVALTALAVGGHRAHARERSEVVLYRMVGGGHAFAGGHPVPAAAGDRDASRQIDGVAHVFDFFVRHAR
jgi:poly(3-hydroxybutyrate) depolymerase